MNNDAAQRRQVGDVVADRVEKLIADGVLKMGQALPSERSQCEKLGISRSALREGLKVLRARGLIKTEQGRGSYVASLMGRDETPMMHLFNTHPRTLFDLLEVRALLEGESARLAALRGTNADFVLIQRRYDEMVAAHASGTVTDPETLARLDHAFHLAVSDASHNPVLVHTLQSLTSLLLSSVFASVKNLYHRPVHKRQLDRQHARLYHAVMERLPIQAKRAAIDHIQSIRDNLQDIENEEQRLERATMRLEGWS
ncbi:transcriptional regulator GlcC [Pseudomonas saliphila]|uniref:transcriptional regulator GlcC n=1 Tax=Pseudomonas saliphila TaxID=2586906 RepID=UPI001238C57F|nr:transcriptional regulator GlcC [Pseudomonas saliphila]